MRKLLLTAIIVFTVCNLRAQFSTDKLQLRFGYNFHNPVAKSVNDLIDGFNNDRYPVIIPENLPSVKWASGFEFGANYLFREDLIFYAILKNRRRFIEVPYNDFPNYRQYLFRARTLEAGIMVPLRDDAFFNHFVGGGLLLGIMEAHTAWASASGYNGSRRMFNIDNSGIIGLSACYEAQFRVNRSLRLFLRPVAQFALSSPIRRLSEFFDPVVYPNGEYVYGPGQGEKYDKASFNGLGIEGGLLFLLPEF